MSIGFLGQDCSRFLCVKHTCMILHVSLCVCVSESTKLHSALCRSMSMYAFENMRNIYCIYIICVGVFIFSVVMHYTYLSICNYIYYTISILISILIYWNWGCSLCFSMTSLMLAYLDQLLSIHQWQRSSSHCIQLSSTLEPQSGVSSNYWQLHLIGGFLNWGYP